MENINDIDDLFYAALERIDPTDADVASEYIVGALTYLQRSFNGRSDRDRVRDDVELNRGLKKYERELTAIIRMSDDALAALIANSIDLSADARHIEKILKHVEKAGWCVMDASKQCSQAKRIAKMMTRIATILEPKKIDRSVNSLFDGME